MKSKAFQWVGSIITVAVLTSSAALAQNATPKRFSGVIDAYNRLLRGTNGKYIWSSGVFEERTE